MPNYKAGKKISAGQKWYKSSYNGVRGCYKRFTATIANEYLGTFDDEKEAALAYDAKARELGKTRNLNFREDGVTRRVSSGRSVYRGVRPQNKKFDAKIGVGYKSEWLGLFDDEKDAALAYDRRARELGRHGSCNFDADGKFRDVGNPAAGHRRTRPAPRGPEAEGAECFERHESPGPAGAAPPGPEAVGWRVSVFWPGEDAWFPGTVRGFDGRRHRIAYDDGDVATRVLFSLAKPSRICLRSTTRTWARRASSATSRRSPRPPRRRGPRPSAGASPSSGPPRASRSRAPSTASTASATASATTTATSRPASFSRLAKPSRLRFRSSTRTCARRASSASRRRPRARSASRSSATARRRSSAATACTRAASGPTSRRAGARPPRARARARGSRSAARRAVWRRARRPTRTSAPREPAAHVPLPDVPGGDARGDHRLSTLRRRPGAPGRWARRRGSRTSTGRRSGRPRRRGWASSGRSRP